MINLLCGQLQTIHVTTLPSRKGVFNFPVLTPVWGAVSNFLPLMTV